MKLLFHSKLLSAWFILLFICLVCYCFYSIDYEHEAWTRHTSRYVGKYINEDLEPHLIPNTFCKEKGDMYVFVMTKPDGLRNRQFIRNTWGKEFSAFNAYIYFLLGETTDKYTQEIVNLESAYYQDIIQDHFVDTYHNLTLKSITMLKLFKQHCSHTAKFLIKLDDDLIVFAQYLLRRLDAFGDNPKNILIGHISHNTNPYREYSSKWYLPYYLYPEDTFPDYLRGPSYAMSADVAVKLYEATWQVPLLPLEDVYLSGQCAKKVGIGLIHDKYFSMCNYDEDVNRCEFMWGYTVHSIDLSVDDLQQLWDDLKSMECNRTSNFEF